MPVAINYYEIYKEKRTGVLYRMDISILNLQDKIELEETTKSLIREAVKACLQREKLIYHVELSIVLVDNDYIKGLNSKYRDIPAPTDVLSFPMIDDIDNPLFHNDNNLLLGDIIISLEKVNEQRKEYGHTFEKELIFLVVHGLLHLLGYDHGTLEEEKKMKDAEKAILASINI